MKTAKEKANLLLDILEQNGIGHDIEEKLAEFIREDRKEVRHACAESVSEMVNFSDEEWVNPKHAVVNVIINTKTN